MADDISRFRSAGLAILANGNRKRGGPLPGEQVVIERLAKGFRIDICSVDTATGKPVQIARYHYDELGPAQALARQLANTLRFALVDKAGGGA